jgi:DNA-binding LytR/AlgR family response regulator
MKCIIVDDEATSRLVIEQLLKDYPSIDLIASLESSVEALKYLNQNEVDLIFLDIHMPAFSGMDFIQTLKNPPYIIMITSDANYALQAFEYDFIVDYLQKPVMPNRLAKAIQKLEKISTDRQSSSSMKTISGADSNSDSSNSELFVNIDRRLIKIEMDKIYLIEAKGDYILIKTLGKNYTVHTTLKKIEEKLPDHTFLKVHRSYIINMTKIVDIEDSSILIEKDVIPVSRSKRPILMERLNLL